MRRTHRWKWLGLLGAVGLIGCGDPLTYEVAPYKVPCQGEAKQLCLLVKEPGSDQRRFFYDEISGFSFQWGVTQTIELRVRDVANPPEDGSSKAYTLERVVERKRVPEGERFQLELTGDYIWGDRLAGFTLLSSPRLVCATDALCVELDGLAGDSTRKVTLEFSYPSRGGQPLVAERLIPVP
jgi:hypothetical protein